MRINRVKNNNPVSNKNNIDLSLIEPLLEENSGKKNLLIPVLQKIQEIYGYLPIQAMERVASSLNLSASDVFGVATFYSQFSLKPKGKYIIKVCTGTACHVTGSKKLLDFINEKLNISETENTTEDGLFTVESVSCLGACGLAPVIVINEKVFSEVSLTSCNEILEKIIKSEKNNR